MGGVYGSRTQLFVLAPKKMNEPPDHQNHTLNLIRVGTEDLGQSNSGRGKVHPRSASGSFQRWDPPPNTQDERGSNAMRREAGFYFKLDSDFQ